jgi:hypothetical protein
LLRPGFGIAMIGDRVEIGPQVPRAGFAPKAEDFRVELLQLELLLAE